LVAIRGKGGTGASTLSLVEGLVNKGHEIAVVCFKRGMLYQNLKGSDKVKLITGIKMASGFKPYQWFKDIIKLYPFIKDFQPHIIHTHSSPDHWLGFLLSLLFGIPLVRTRHIPVSVRFHPFNALLYNNTEAVVAVSHAVERGCTSAIRNPSKIKVIPDGVDLERFHPNVSSNGFRKDLGVKKGDVLIGSIARYSRVKGLFYFLDALLIVFQRYSNVKGIIAGRVKEKELFFELTEWIKSKNLKDKIHLLEYTNEIENLIDALDIVVLASVGSEGSSRVSLEAMAMAKPLIGTKVGAIPEIAVHNHTGFIVPPKDKRALANAMELLFNRCLKRAMGKKALFRANNFFSRDNTVNRIEDLYIKLIS